MLLLASVLMLFSNTLNAQSKEENLQAQAQKMGGYFKAENYGPYVKFVNQKVIELAGGSENMIKLIGQQMGALKNNQMQVEEVSMGKPTSIIEHNDQLQSTVPQTLVISTPESRITSKYNLIALSDDNGKNWTFIDTSGKDIETMRKTFPHLSAELILPAKQMTQK